MIGFGDLKFDNANNAATSLRLIAEWVRVGDVECTPMWPTPPVRPGNLAISFDIRKGPRPAPDDQ